MRKSAVARRVAIKSAERMYAERDFERAGNAIIGAAMVLAAPGNLRFLVSKMDWLRMKRAIASRLDAGERLNEICRIESIASQVQK